MKNPSSGLPVDIPQEELERLESYFGKAPFLGHQEQPCIVLDMYGRIVLWYMPGIIAPARVVCHYKHCFHIVTQFLEKSETLHYSYSNTQPSDEAAWN